MKRIITSLLIATFAHVLVFSANKPEREEWFRNLGFGMFIHWNVDSQLGVVISHSLAGADEAYVERYFSELPRTFNPKKFDPSEWAILARLAGMKYVMFTAKHHSGFCMWNTKTTEQNVMNTPFGRDITKEIIDAFRQQGIAVGLYFSPEDFLYFHQTGVPIGRLQHDMHYPVNNRGLMDYDKRQLKELLTQYGPIDLLFLDGPADGLKEYAWKLNPDIVVTRGEMETPEQKIREYASVKPWESCFTMGTDWQYKPTNDPHKTGTQVINMLMEVRAKGGNLLLNVGPKPDGEIQIEHEAILREVALWNFVNGECVHGVRPWHEIKQDKIWFTSSVDGKTVYAVVPAGKNWPYGERAEFFFKHLKTTPSTRISILSYASTLVEYRPQTDASIRFNDSSEGLHVSAVNGHRLYTNNQWPNPVVFKIENVDYTGESGASVKEEIRPNGVIDGAI